MVKKQEVETAALDDVLTLFNDPDVSAGRTNMDNAVLDAGNQNAQDTKSQDGNDADDNTQIPQDVVDRMNGKSTEEPTQTTTTTTNDDNNDTVDQPLNQPVDDEPTPEDVAEAQQVTTLFDAIIESLGYNPNDIDGDKKPLTVDDLTSSLTNIVRENSKPQYADERVAQLDNYVKNGGKFEDFYNAQQSSMSLDDIDLEDESNQKRVVRELLKLNGYTDERINKRIERFEDADMLYEEAEDAVDRLKEIKKQQTEELEKQQMYIRQQQEQQAQQFFSDVKTQIDGLNSIRGVNVPKEDRRALFDYIFRQDANGMTQYQKDFNKNLSKNLIESAYFTMKGDSLINEAQRDGQTSAAQKLRNMLRDSSRNHSSRAINDGKQPQAWDIASKFL